MKRREMAEYGYIAFNGEKWCDLHVEQYNRIQARINAWIDDGIEPPDYLLDMSHRAYHLFSRLV